MAQAADVTTVAQSHGALLGEETAHGEVIPPEAQGFAATVIAFLAIALAALAPIATRAARMDKGWWVEPKTWPLVCLSAVIVTAGYLALQWWLGLRLADDREGYLARSRWAFGGLGPAFEYAAYFCVYLFAVSYLGFALSSLVFMQVLIWRAGLRSRAWKLAALAFVFAVVLAFRVGIQLWFPMAPLFEYAPDWFIQNIAIYL